jgi:hypothetical protein
MAALTTSRVLALAVLLATSTGCGLALEAGGALAAVLSQSSSKKGVVIISDLDASLVLSRGPFDAGDTTEGKGAPRVVISQFQMTPTKDTTLRTLTLTASGTGNAQSIPAVRIFQDMSGVGALDSSSVQLGQTTTFSGGNATFSDLGLAMPGGKAVNFLIVMDMPSSAKDGDTFQIAIARASSVDAIVTASGKETEVLGAPLLSGVKTISSTGTLRIFTGPSSPPNQTVFSNARGVALLQVELRSSSVEPVTISQLRLDTSGTVNAADVAGADLYVDVNGDGKLTPGVDLPIQLGAVPQGNQGPIVFSGINQTIPASSVVEWLVVVDLSGSAQQGATFRGDILATADLTVTGETSKQAITPSGIPVTGGATLTVKRASLSIALGPTNPGEVVVPGTTLAPVLQLALSAGAVEPVTISSIGVVGSGSGNDATELSGVRLYVDVNGTGVVTSNDILLAGPATYAVDKGKIVFSGFQRTIAAGASEDWLVAYDVSGGATGGHTFTATLSGPGDVTATGQASGLVFAPTAPGVTGGTLTVVGSVNLGNGTHPPGSGFVFQNQTGVPVLQATLTTGGGEAERVTSLRFVAQGSGSPQTGLTGVHLYADGDGLGVVDSSCVLLGQATSFSATNDLTFTIAPGSLDIPPSSSVSLLLAFDFGGTDSSGQTFGAEIASSKDVVAQGLSSGFAATETGGPVVGGLQTIAVLQPAITISQGVVIAPGPVGPNQTNVPMLQLRFTETTGNGAVTLTSLAVTPTGSGNAVNDVSAVTLWIDANSNGVVDAGDTQVGGTKYFAAGGPAGFGGLSVNVPAGGHTDVLIAYGMASGAAVVPGKTYGTQVMVGAATLQTTVGGLPVTPTGLPQSGPTRTVPNPSVNVAAGPANPVGTLVARNLQTGLVMEQLALTAGIGSDVVITQLQVTGAGTANSQTGVAALSIVRDVNGNGVVDAGDVVLAHVVNPFPAAHGTAVVSLSDTIAAGTSADYLVVYDLANGSLANQTFVANASSVAVAAPGTVSGTFPISGRTVSVVGGVSVSLGGGNPNGQVLALSATKAAVLELRITADVAESMTVTALTVTAGGTADASSSVTAARLYQDNGDDVFQPGVDTLLATKSPQPFPQANGSVTFGGLGISIPAGSSASLWFAIDLNGSPPAIPGLTFVATLASNGNLAVTGSVTGTNGVSGAPIAGNAFETGPSPAIFDSPTNLPLLASGVTVVEVATGDLNRDGKQDYVLLLSDGRFEVHLGQGDGTFVAGPGSGIFGTAGTPGPVAIAIGDVNRDGYPDVVVAYQQKIAVFLNGGAASPASFATEVDDSSAGASYEAIALVDFNRDGALDVVAANATGPRLEGFQNSGTGTFTLTSTLALAAAPLRLAVADYDNDGFQDVALLDAGAHLVLATGNGTFFTVVDTVTVGGSPTDLVAVDLDRNGYPDVVVVDPNAVALYVYKSNAPASASFSLASGPQAAAPPGTASAPVRLVAGDWNADGRLDIAAACAAASPADGVVAHLGSGTLAFDPTTVSVYAGGGQPDRIAVADFNGDGRPDLLTASSITGTVALWVGHGSTNSPSGFAAPVTVSWTRTPVSVAAGDFNRDGLLDLVAVAQEKFVSVWLNNGNGTSYTKGADVALVDVPSMVRTADMNRDGKLDLVVSIAGGGANQLLQVFLGNGDGTFQAPVSATALGGAQPVAFALGDLNRDGILDAVAAMKNQNSFQVFHGNGTGFNNPVAADEYATGNQPIDIALADLTRNGKLDVVLVTQGGKTLEVRLGNGDGTFGAALAPIAVDPLLNTPNALAVGDLDGDGIPDAIVLSQNQGYMQVFKGNGDGTFTAAGTLQIGTSANETVLADFLHHGELDVVLVSSAAPGGVTVVPNAGKLTFAFPITQSGPPNNMKLLDVAVGDLDRDGKLDAVAADQQNKALQVFLGQ